MASSDPSNPSFLQNWILFTIQCLIVILISITNLDGPDLIVDLSEGLYNFNVVQIDVYVIILNIKSKI